MAKIISGKALSVSLRSELAVRAQKFYNTYKRKVGLAVIKVGEDAASAIYVRNKIKACAECDFKSFEYYLPETVTQTQLNELIGTLNADDNIDGILVQLPLPPHISERDTVSLIDPDKDADGFHLISAGRLFTGEKGTLPCTPAGIMALIDSTGVSIEGKNAVVIGRSNIVGKPAAMLLLSRNATVTVCHSRTKNISDFTKNADILVVAVGKKSVVTGDMIKKGAIVIDVGMNRDDSGLCGDVEFSSASEVAGYITPVPGGVGPMTITMLLSNTLNAAERRMSK